MQKIYRNHPWRCVISIKLFFMPKCDVNSVAHTSAWVFSYKFAAYFQNTFL